MTHCATGGFFPAFLGGGNLTWIIVIVVALFLFSNPCFKSGNLIWIIVLAVFLFSQCGGAFGGLGGLFGPAAPVAPAAC